MGTASLLFYEVCMFLRCHILTYGLTASLFSYANLSSLSIYVHAYTSISSERANEERKREREGEGSDSASRVYPPV